jgi:hypothetical protein
MKPEGALVVKLFHGSGYNELVNLFKQTFKVVKPIKPKARATGRRDFLVGISLEAGRRLTHWGRNGRFRYRVRACPLGFWA